MDNLIFFKKAFNLKSDITKIRFSYTREYSLTFAQNINQLTQSLKELNEALLFYFTDNLTFEERITLNNINKVFPKIKICLCTNTAFAINAWQMHLFHFIAQPVKNIGIEDAYKKYVTSLGGFDLELKINTKEGLVRIPFNMINYLRASGNYTQVFLRGDKSLIETKQLQKYTYFTERDLRMKRLHRSFIFNLGNVKTIGKGFINFYSTKEALKLSKSLESKIKSTLLAQ